MKVTDKTSHFSLIWGGGYRNKSLSKSLGAAVFLSFGSSGGPLGPLGLLDEQKRSRWRLRIQNSENVPFWVYPPVVDEPPKTRSSRLDLVRSSPQMASRDVVLRRWEHSTGMSGASGACVTVVGNSYLTYLTTKKPCFHSFPCRVAPKRPLVYSRSVSRDDRRRVRYESRRHSGGAEEAAGGFI